MDEQPSPTECDQSRAMWHWVGASCVNQSFNAAGQCQKSKADCIKSLDRAALCQIYDSIFRTSPSVQPLAQSSANLTEEDLPMSRVKFNVNTEYAYLQNFKILQSSCSSSPALMHALTDSSSQTASRNTKSTAPFQSKASLNARCKTISNSSNGPSATGTNTSLVATMMLLHGGKVRERLLRPPRHHRQLHARQARGLVLAQEEGLHLPLPRKVPDLEARQRRARR